MKALGIKKDKYQRLVKDDMPCVRLGPEATAHRRFDLDKVIAWLDERRVDDGQDDNAG